MPRHARVLNDKQIYHIMLRGNNKEKIFIDDKERILDTIEDKKQKGEFYLYAFCIMDNHIHLLIREGTDGIARIIKRIATSYAYFFNKKYRRIGHVFQDRYRSENIKDDSYLLAAMRYIHRNPVKAGICNIEEYKWSSYKEYIGKKSSLVDVGQILGMFSGNKDIAAKEFASFNREDTGEIFLDVEDAGEKAMDEANIDEYIKRYLSEKGLETDELRSPKNRGEREELIRQLLEKSNLSRRGVALALGLSREMVRRVNVSEEPSP